MNTSTIVQKLWNYCNVLRDDGMSYGDYVEQLTYLLFLKMADERTKPPYHQPSIVPVNMVGPVCLRRMGMNYLTTIVTCWKVWVRKRATRPDLRQIPE